MAMTRRGFLGSTTLSALSQTASAQQRMAVQRRPAEWSFSSGRAYKDPFNEIELDVIFRAGNGSEYRVPAFWAGDQVWRVRFAAPAPGRYAWRTSCNDTANRDLHGIEGNLDVTPYTGNNPLLKHGPVRVASDRRHFEHEDGTPFFWLADTWWMGLCRRLRWPEDFQTLASDRVMKGFTVVQIVAGLYPDMPPFDARGENEAGCPWEKDFTRINPAYFDMADIRMLYLVDRGIVPCVVGCWGYFLPLIGTTKMKRHWRYLVARWGALPAVWCLAGEATMPWYLSKQPKEDAATQKQGWTDIARYVRQIDSAHHMITVHPSASARESVEDDRVLDFDMLQTGHSDRDSMPNTIRRVTASFTKEPRMPVVNGEVCYEGILEASRQEIQRFMFWTCILNGAAGHTYGANGIWQVNTAEQPYGPSPHGRSWGDTPWEVAYQLPGSRQLGLGRKFLSKYPWWRMEPHPEWVQPHGDEKNYIQPYAAGIPGELRIIFMPPMWNPPKLKAIEPNRKYRASFFNPSDGRMRAIGDVDADSSGEWPVPNPPTFQDWVLVLDASA
jgi:hypothetical protein